ncbi:MAG: phosphoenolpyruvate--protein phosphotransferase [Deltaproteobacteria bacterium]|nr:phosphoenolpyruvate--protein phosphotransferase [Deltaproteobacteria bacterium]
MTSRLKPRGERIRGIGVGGGIAAGTAYVLNRRLNTIPRRRLRADDAAAEKSRLLWAVEASVRQFDEARARLPVKDPGMLSDIVEAYRMMIADPTLVNRAAAVVERDLINAEWAIEREVERLKEAFEHAEDVYLVERRTDLDHIAGRVLRNLMGVAEPPPFDPQKPGIVVAHNLSPADIVGFVKHKVIAFATDVGGPASHSAILARSLGIPAVIGTGSVSEKTAQGEEIVIDGTHGDVWLHPDAAAREKLLARGERYRTLMESLSGEAALPMKTADHKELTVMANVEFTEEVDSAKRHGARGVGLLRTEYLFVNRRRAPAEEEHFRAYQQVAAKMAPYPVTIRTLDVGGDKIGGPFRTWREPNPALGMRAIRFCLKEKHVFIPQIRGILRASSHGRVRLLVPMISSVEEAVETKRLVSDVMEQFERDGIPYDRDIEIGCMIEVPAAAITADLLAKEFDFFSIGTNDLIQYTLAVDRGNDRVAHLFQPFHPAVLRLIKNTVDVARHFGIGVAVCGEMASAPIPFLLLLGAGIREFSMYPQAIPFIRHTARCTTVASARQLFEAVMEARNPAEASHIAEEFLGQHFPEVCQL